MKSNTIVKYLIYYLLNICSLSVYGQAITRKPYLQMGTPTSIVIKWRTDLATDSKVNVGLSSTQLTSSFLDPTNTTEHEVKISNLQPNTVYYYNVGGTYGVLGGDNSYFFKTAPAVGSTQPIRIWAMGDMGDGSDNQKKVRDEYLKYIGNDNRKTDFVMLLGDNAYPNGMDNEYQVNFFDIYKDSFLTNNVLWPVPGNHEYYAANRNSRGIPYYSIFTLPKNAELGGVLSGVESYYSFDYANVHIIALDSDGIEENQYRLYDTISPQVNWLKRDLAANRQPWTIVMFHHPPHTKNSHDSDAEEELRLIKQNLTPILERYKVDMVLSGHSHIYERSMFIKGHTGASNTFSVGNQAVVSSTGRYDSSPNSCAYIKKNEGIIYAVVGSSGRNNGVPGPWHPMSAFADQTTGGSLALEIENNRLDAKWIASTGIIKDQFTIFKNVNKQTNLTANYGTDIKLTPSWKGTYNWPDGSKSATFNPKITKDITVEVRDDQKCLADQFTVRVLAVPTITTTDLANPAICLGSSVPVAFVTSGFTSSGRLYSVQLSDLSGNFTTPTIIGTGSVSPISATIPATATLGFQYRLRVVADSMGITSVPSSAILLMRKPTAALSGGGTINVGDSTALNIAFTGNGPWTYAFTNTNTGTTSANPLIGSVKPTVTTTYTLASISNVCGAGTVSGSATVIVNPRISTAALAIGSTCVGANVSIPFVVTGTFVGAVTYTAQLSDAVGNFTNPTAIGVGAASPIAGILPATLPAGSGYRIRVVANLTATYVNSTVFSILSKPTATLTGGATVNVGDSTTFNIVFTGNSPWTYAFTNTNTGTTSVNPLIGTVKPTVTTTYTLASVSNICGAGTVSGSATVIVNPRISTATLAIGSVCVGTSVSVPFVVTGGFSDVATYTAQLSDALGGFANPIVIGTGTGSPISSTLPLTLAAGAGYRIRVVANLTATTVSSTPFTIKIKPTAIISGSTSINVEATANLSLTFTGDSPWNYVLSDGTTATVTTATSLVIVKPMVSTTYSIISLTNNCGAGVVSGSVKITVAPRISVATLNLGNVCVGGAINVPFVLTGAFETTPTYTVQLSDGMGSFANPTAIGTGTTSPIVATVPAGQSTGSNYFVRVVANGSTSVGSLAFNIRPLPTAVISGNQTIDFGNTVSLNLILTGDAPWKYTLSDGTIGTAARSPLVIDIKTDQTKTYTVTKINNVCGDGTSSGSAAVIVVPRLVTENVPSFICAGTTAGIRFGVGGVLVANTSYQVQLSDSSGRFNSPIIIGTGTSSPVSSVIPANTISGNNYRLRVVAVNNNTNSTPSSTFFVRTKATGVLTGGGVAIKPSEEALLIIQTTGDAPWSYVLSDNTTGTSTVSPIIISVFPIYPTTYTIKSITNACGVGVSSGSAVVNVIITSLDSSLNDEVTVYPNPIQNEVNLSIKLSQPQDGEWQLFNEAGQFLKSRKLIKSKNHEEVFSTENIPSGTYLLKIRVGQNWTIRKLIKN